MSDCMHFPDTIEEFMEQYKMTDTKQVYSNGTEYVPIFRMEQWFEHEKAQLSQEGTTSDLIDRQAVIKVLECWQKAFKENSHHASASDLSLVVKDIRALSATHVATDTNVGNNSEIPNNSDCISRQAALGITDKTVDTNPSHFEAHQKFIQFMDDKQISSFGRWQWSNGFNTALVAMRVDLKSLPPAQPEPTDEQVAEYCKRRCLHIVTDDFFRVTQPEVKEGQWIQYDKRFPWRFHYKCSECGNYLDFSGVNGGRGKANYCPNCGAKMTISK